MESTVRTATLLASMLLAAAVSLGGCAARTGQTQKTTATLQGVQDDYELAKMQTEATKAALVELEVSAVPDLEQAYHAFSKSVDRMQQIGRRLLVHADALHFDGAPYLVESEKSGAACVYPRLSRPENRREADIGDHFDAVVEEGWQVKRAFRDYQFDISQIQNHLTWKLTPSDVQAMSRIIEKAKVDAESLKLSLEHALAAIESAKAAKVQPATTGG